MGLVLIYFTYEFSIFARMPIEKTKLTLSLNPAVIAKAKTYARHRQTSISQLVEAYLDAISSETRPIDDIPISPLVASMIVGKAVPDGVEKDLAARDERLSKHR